MNKEDVVKAVSEKTGVAALSTLAVVDTGDACAALAAVAHQQTTAAAVLTFAAVGAVADQQAAVLARFVAVADEHRERRTEDAGRIDGKQGKRGERSGARRCCAPSGTVADDGRRRMAESRYRVTVLAVPYWRHVMWNRGTGMRLRYG